MRFLFVLIFLVGVAYAWFSWYQPSPSAGNSTMQAAINSFQRALEAKDVQAMRALCTDSVASRCSEIIERIERWEQRYSVTIASVGSFGFDFPRGRTVVDGFMRAVDSDGDEMWDAQIRVSQDSETGDWFISHLQ
jgi:hypothetical protein